jgi:hypothetical protein
LRRFFSFRGHAKRFPTPASSAPSLPFIVIGGKAGSGVS